MKTKAGKVAITFLAEKIAKYLQIVLKGSFIESEYVFFSVQDTAFSLRVTCINKAYPKLQVFDWALIVSWKNFI